ncbi:MAG: hypothetical protein U0228_05330 [Myxococcaceae bacterium]
MHVKGNAWLSRAAAMEKEFGAERWKQFVTTQKASFLQAPVMPISRIDVDEFLSVNDAMVREFYAGDEKAWWRFGEMSAQWALANQLRGLFAEHEGKRFLFFSPTIYKNYFDAGELVVESTPATVDLIIRNVGRTHVYFEYSIIGFAVGGLKVLKVEAAHECIKGFSKGDDEVRYRFAVTK